MKEKIIMIDTELRQKIYQEFGVTPPTVKDALEFETDTYLAKSIRTYALDNGGEIWVPLSQQEGGQHEC